MEKLIHYIISIIFSVMKNIKSKGRALIRHFTNYSSPFYQKYASVQKPVGPIVKSLRGSFHASPKIDYKKSLTEILSKKYSIKPQ
jgi:hypothetical protein